MQADVKAFACFFYRKTLTIVKFAVVFLFCTIDFFCILNLIPKFALN